MNNCLFYDLIIVCGRESWQRNFLGRFVRLCTKLEDAGMLIVQKVNTDSTVSPLGLELVLRVTMHDRMHDCDVELH